MNPEHLGFHMDYLLLEIETISGGDAKLKKNLVNIINNLIKQIKVETDGDTEKCFMKVTEIMSSISLESYEWDGKKSKLVWKYESAKYLNLKKEILN